MKNSKSWTSCVTSQKILVDSGIAITVVELCVVLSQEKNEIICY